MTQEALKLALEALERSVATCFDQYAHQQVMSQPDHFINKAITAIKEALREHAMREVQRLGQEIEQEPVVGITAIRTWFKDGRVVTQTLCNSWVDTTPPQPEQEPVAWINEHGHIDCGLDAILDPTGWTPLYTHPPQRTWVDLTDEEENEYNYLGPDMHWVIQEIAAKLKEKNT
jgi:hypothetical protein